MGKKKDGDCYRNKEGKTVCEGDEPKGEPRTITSFGMRRPLPELGDENNFVSKYFVMEAIKLEFAFYKGTSLSLLVDNRFVDVPSMSEVIIHNKEDAVEFIEESYVLSKKDHKDLLKGLDTLIEKRLIGVPYTIWLPDGTSGSPVYLRASLVTFVYHK